MRVGENHKGDMERVSQKVYKRMRRGGGRGVAEALKRRNSGIRTKERWGRQRNEERKSDKCFKEEREKS